MFVSSRVVCLAIAWASLAPGQAPFSGKTTTTAAETVAVLRTSGVPMGPETATTESVSVRVSLPAMVTGVTTSAASPLKPESLRIHPSPVARERFPRLAAGMIVAIAVDRGGIGVHWSSYADPTVVRAELPGAGGILTGTVAARPGMDLFVDIPNDERIVELRLYRVIEGTTGLRLVAAGRGPWSSGGR